MSLKIAFLGTPEFSVPTLKLLANNYDSNHLSVISMPDKIRGRGRNPSPSPVKNVALQYNLPVYTPHSKTELSETLFDINPDLVLVIAYGMLIEKRIVDHFFCVNAHASILPKYRGASPIQSSLLNGDLLTGITLIKLNERMDAGDVLLTSKLKITTQDTFGSLSEKLSKLTADVCTSFIRGSFIANQYTLTPQDESLATYCTKIQKDDLFLSDDLSPLMIHNKIKAYSPLPGAYCILNGKRIKVLDASFENDHLQFLIVQPEGKAAMSYSDYLLGNPGGIGIYGN